MARPAALAAAALAGLLAAGCAGGSFGQTGLSLPAADGLQTVSDAADALDAHRTSASENAKAAIAVTDALGSFVRDISADQRSQAAGASHAFARSLRQYTVERNGKRITSGSELVLPAGRTGGDFCQSSAGYMVNGIPSLDETFGWETGAYRGGTMAEGARGSSVWSAHADGAVVQGAIGSLSIARNGGGSCEMNTPAFVLRGAVSANGFSIPLSMAFRRGELVNLSVVNGHFASGDSLQVTTRSDRQGMQVNGAVANGRTQVATLRANAHGDGTLTITSTGAQYVIADWVVVGT